MGIKHFFYWFKNQFSENIKKYKRKKEDKGKLIDESIDNLFLDMNGIFHNSTQKIYKYGNYKENFKSLLFPNRNKRVDFKVNNTKVYLDVCQTIELILDLVKPNKRLVLCVDGPAPLSKQNQQRQRRFRSAKENSKIPFDTNSITPGTKFMDNLTKYIDWFLRYKINTEDKWRNIEIIFSNEKVPGEGEHKLVNYIRKYGVDTESFCIYGLDADLYMLALATHKPNFYIFREDLYDPSNDYFLIDIGKIRQDLVKFLKWDSPKHKFNEKKAINDFIFLCFMVGNDFLPHIPSIEIIENGIEILFDAYRYICKHLGHITYINSNNDVKFIRKTLAVYIGTLGQYEKLNYESKLNRGASFFPDELLNKYSYQDKKGNWTVEIEKYNKEYCEQKFTNLDHACNQYIEGLQWVLSYYTKGISNWRWNYNYQYAPPASVLSKYIEDFVFPVYTETYPSTPYQQLLCVLPPKSSHLIPYPLNTLLTTELQEFCPTDFTIDLSGKRREWEGIVILPSVDFNKVSEIYYKHIDKVEQREIKRNRLGKSFIYKYTLHKPKTFFSYYGNIENCCVNTEVIEI